MSTSSSQNIVNVKNSVIGNDAPDRRKTLDTSLTNSDIDHLTKNVVGFGDVYTNTQDPMSTLKEVPDSTRYILDTLNLTDVKLEDLTKLNF